MAHAWGQNLLLLPGSSATFGDSPSRLLDGLLAPVNTAPALTSPAYLTLGLGEARDVSCVALLNDDFGAQAVTVSAEVQGSVDAAFTSPVSLKSASALAATTHRRVNHALCYPSASYRWLRLKLTFSGTLTLRCGEVFVGLLTVLPRPLALQGLERLSYAMNSIEMRQGERRTKALSGPYRTRQIRVEDASSSDKEAFRAMFRASLGGARPLLYVPSLVSSTASATDAEQDCLFGRAQEDSSAAHARAPAVHELDGFSLRSLSRGML